MPRLNRVSFRRWFRSRTPLAPLRGRNGSVRLFCDEFTDANDLAAGVATVELLERLGYEVSMPAHAESGRASFSKGLLRRAKGFAERNVRALSSLVTEETPLVGVEPSTILGFRDEYPSLVSSELREAARKLGEASLTLEEFLAREADADRIGPELFTDESQVVWVHGHCHQKALASMEPSLRALSLPRNFRVKAIPSGCCGMAGSFGYEVEHFEISRRIGELVLFPAARSLPEGALLAAAGTSCRHQIHDGTGREALHPAEILRAALKDAME